MSITCLEPSHHNRRCGVAAHYLLKFFRRMRVSTCLVLRVKSLVIIQLLIAPALSFDRDYVLYVWTLHLDELFIFILVACAELILMIDQREIAGE